MDLDIDRYIVPSDGMDPNTDTTQEEIEYRGFIQFFMDSITKTIGTDTCRINIDTYWDRLHLQLQNTEPNILKNFYVEVISEIFKKYNLTIIDSEIGNYDKSFDKIDCIQFLEFFEKGKCCDFIINAYSIDDFNILMDDNVLFAFLDEEQIKITSYIRNTFNPLIIKQFEYFSHFEKIELILNLIKRYKNEAISLIVEYNTKQGK